MHRFARDTEDFSTAELEQLRARLAKMSDAELRRFGKAARDCCRPVFGEPPRKPFLVQLEEARAEYRRRKTL
jgi:hypothetical protein